ncbi:hypothetical protein [Arcobacter roscoffensis]|uniref:Uncharacterized protein n=1 Tax=Arcobacter roscoffensis TaxID=2961520 RepID=A0ABY5E3A5_9BACT|nr:hypothetical protein [Arcobacter roscoffensis]UTJ05538.1 hypothetical protein NJU99_09700 [Arcobacter roscoffensis]
MAKPNYNYEKRAREIEKQKKKEEKRLKKQAAKENKDPEDSTESQE